jgi:hypothetical protein
VLFAVLVFVFVRKVVKATDISDGVVEERWGTALFATLSKIVDRKRDMESRNPIVVNATFTHCQSHV